MKAELKSIDLNSDKCFEDYKPSDSAKFELFVTCTIGPVGVDGGDIFQFHVATPPFVGHSTIPDDHLWLDRSLLVKVYDPDIIRLAIETFIESCAGSTWESIASQISSIGDWEFEEYEQF